eukprot:5088272-Lingulodinium_polyedra.AAC.1
MAGVIKVESVGQSAVDHRVKAITEEAEALQPGRAYEVFRPQQKKLDLLSNTMKRKAEDKGSEEEFLAV